MKASIQSPVNFIKHLDVFLEIVGSVDSINFTQVAVYLSLFRIWNISFFTNPISPSREEIMKYAGLKSKESFYRIIREMEAFDLIRYYPSRSKFERSFYCISPLEFDEDRIKISVFGLTNHNSISNEQKKSGTLFNDGMTSSSKDIRSKADLYNGRGTMILEKIIFLRDGVPSNEPDNKPPSSFDPLTDPKYASFLDNRNSSPSNNSYYANKQDKHPHRSGLRPSGVPTDPNADYSKRL
jgi:hypothetical protein